MKSDEHLDIQQGNQGTYTYKDGEKQLIWRMITLGDQGVKGRDSDRQAQPL